MQTEKEFTKEWIKKNGLPIHTSTSLLEESISKIVKEYHEQQVNSVDLADVGGSLPDAELAKQLLEVRDQLVRSDVNEAYHILCKAADPDLTTVNHWEKWENIAGQ